MEFSFNIGLRGPWLYAKGRAPVRLTYENHCVIFQSFPISQIHSPPFFCKFHFSGHLANPLQLSLSCERLLKENGGQMNWVSLSVSLFSCLSDCISSFPGGAASFLRFLVSVNTSPFILLPLGV